MFGKHSIFAAIKNPARKIHKIFCLENVYKQHHRLLPEKLTTIVDHSFLEKKIGKNQHHQGIIAEVESIWGGKLEDLILKDNTDAIAVLDQISDPQNIGAIIRNAAAFGITKIILPADNCPEESAIIAKAASGTLELVQVIKVVNLKNTLLTLKQKGFWIVGLDVNGTEQVNQIRDFAKIVVVIGSEGKGMRRLTADTCDLLVKIPISEKVESLNAACAASIIFHELKTLGQS